MIARRGRSEGTGHRGVEVLSSAVPSYCCPAHSASPVCTANALRCDSAPHSPAAPCCRHCLSSIPSFASACWHCPGVTNAALLPLPTAPCCRSCWSSIPSSGSASTPSSSASAAASWALLQPLAAAARNRSERPAGSMVKRRLQSPSERMTSSQFSCVSAPNFSCIVFNCLQAMYSCRYNVHSATLEKRWQPCQRLLAPLPRTCC